MKKVLLLALMMCCMLHIGADDFWGNVEINARLGYTFGGSAPLPMPASIRKINSYSLGFCPQIGVDAVKPFATHWAVYTGVRFENKGMDEDAMVKNYHTAIMQGANHLEGMYTGNENTHLRQWMFTIPLQAVLRLNKLDLRVGPYVSFLTSHRFYGYAHEGYLRVTDPTGPRVDIGNDENTRGSYDFSDDMRRTQWGVGIGADWRPMRKVGFYAELNWGLMGIFSSHFKTVEQPLYPIYATLGVSYKIK
ncbi:MAG: porin family protein [Prevotella sp.]|nr:porin family protein [Prevotella sp.]